MAVDVCSIFCIYMLCEFNLRILGLVSIFFCNVVCECTVVVDVGDGTTIALTPILSNIVMGCIVLEGK